MSEKGRNKKNAECRLCGKMEAWSGTRLYDRCWELSSRIQDSPEIALRIMQDLKLIPKEVSSA